MPVRIYGTTTVYVSYVVTLVIIAQFGPPGVVLLAPFDALRSHLANRRSVQTAIFNAGMHTIVYCSAAFAFGAISPYAPQTIETSLFLGIAAATVTSVVVNALLINGRLFFFEGAKTTWAQFWTKHSWLIPHFASMGFVGSWLNVAYIDHGLVGIGAFMAPVVMLRVAMKQYVDKTAENVEKLEKQNDSLKVANIEIRRMSDELRDSYDGTLEALVNALDARDQETKGHSIRVSHYMMDIAREFGVKEGTSSGPHGPRCSVARRRKDRRQRRHLAQAGQADRRRVDAYA